MKQTGLITKRQDSDYLAGTLLLERVMLDRDWRSFRPISEKQYNYDFDTKSCTTFSCLNGVEFWLNFLKDKFSIGQKKELTDMGYLLDGEFNFSDRFTAIMSGTTPEGNWHQKVLDSIRNDGLLPEKDLPFGGDSWDAYHNKLIITQAMIDKAQKFRKFIEIAYEYDTTYPNQNIGESLEYCPLLAAIPYPAYHAVVLPSPNFIFDTYEPFLYMRQVDVHYSFKLSVKIKPEVLVTQVPRSATITRIVEDSKETLGTLEAHNLNAVLMCKTLELPWQNNLKNISSIPKGTYKVRWTFSSRFLRYTYEVQDVPGRTGIRIHPANYFFQLNGCVALGDKLVDINGDGKLDVTNSRATLALFESFMQKQEFTLKIV